MIEKNNSLKFPKNVKMLFSKQMKKKQIFVSFFSILFCFVLFCFVDILMLVESTGSVDDMFKFENIGFLKTVAGAKVTQARHFFAHASTQRKLRCNSVRMQCAVVDLCRLRKRADWRACARSDAAALSGAPKSRPVHRIVH